MLAVETRREHNQLDLGSEVRLISAAFPGLNGAGEPAPMGRSVVNIKS